MTVPKPDLQELKSLSAPPAAVKNVGIAAVILQGEYNPSDDEYQRWKKWQRFASSQDALDRLNKFDAKTVTPEQLEAAKKLMEGLSEEGVQKKNKAVCSLYRWVQKTIQDAAA